MNNFVRPFAIHSICVGFGSWRWREYRVIQLASPCVGCWHQKVNSNTLDVTGAGSCVRLDGPQG